MMYKERIETLLDTLESKLSILKSVANGSIQLNAEDIIFIIEDCKKVNQQLKELISIER
jgi:hypothetical protein